jgi:predicted hotdog family 3-hydroxylacyl-ACP dehydratase
MNLPAADFLPHTPPLLLVRTLLEIDENSVSCEAVLDDSVTPFLDSANALPAWFLIEMIAQTIGVWAGWHDHARGIALQSGLLLGCRQFTCEQPAFPPGTRLRINAQKLIEDNGTGSFEAQVFAGGTDAVARATLTTHQTTWNHLDSLLKR